MDKNKAQDYYRYLDEKYTEWYTHPKMRPAIEAEIYKAAMQWDAAINAQLRNGRGAGLFESGFFQSDVLESFEYLRGIISV